MVVQCQRSHATEVPCKERSVKFWQGRHGIKWLLGGVEKWSEVAWSGRKTCKTDVVGGYDWSERPGWGVSTCEFLPPSLPPFLPMLGYVEDGSESVCQRWTRSEAIRMVTEGETSRGLVIMGKESCHKKSKMMRWFKSTYKYLDFWVLWK